MRLVRLAFVITALFVISPTWSQLPKGMPGPLTPDQALRSFQIRDGYRVELVAAEPHVQDPVAMAWDEDGRMFVVEMGDYPNGPVGGKVRLLEDTDGDGKIDKSTVFADKLPFPTGLFPWKGGLLVTAAPDILYLKDANGDGKADERKVLFTGFGEGNQQHRVNGLIWGIDNWIYGANGDSGGVIYAPDDPKKRKVNISGRDFRFRPDTLEFETVSGHSQFGIAFDEWGHRFMCDNRCHIRMEVLPEQYLKRAPHLAVKATTENIAEYGPVGARVYPISPSQERFNDYDNLNHFTSACGIHIYRGGLMKELEGNAFVCEPVHNLVHRCELEPNGPILKAKRAPGEEQKEFLASTDPWFRPVYLATGPDGALYIADFYRPVLEHPKWIPESVQKRVDLRAGADKGRIYRVVPKDWKYDSSFRVQLSKAKMADLVLHLGNPNAWWRDTAQRLIYQFKAPHEFVGAWQAMNEKWDRNPVASHRFWSTAAGLGKVEPFFDPTQKKLPAIQLASDPDIRLRFHAAFALGELPLDEAQFALAQLLEKDGANHWFRAAVLTSVARDTGRFIRCVFKERRDFLKEGNPAKLKFLREFAAMLAAEGKHVDEFIEVIMKDENTAWQFAAISGLAEGSFRSKTSMEKLKPHLGKVLKEAERIARNETQPVAARVEAVGLTVFMPLADAGPVLASLIDHRQPGEVQIAAVQALGKRTDPEVAGLLLKNWKTHSPAVRREVMETIFRNRDRLSTLLDAMESKQVLAADLDPQRQDQLLKLLEGEQLIRAKKLLGDARPDRRKIVEEYRAALTMPRDFERGRVVFEKNCMTCHRWENKGHAVGPDLADVRGRPDESLLDDILDPNKALSPGFTSYVLETTNGQLITGVLATETATSVTLRRAEAAEDIVLRKNIAGLQSTGQSLMPEGVEKQMTKQDVADLLGYLKGEKK